MKSFIRNFSTRLPILANRSSALERAVRPSPKSRRLKMEPLENRELPAVDAFGVSASLADSDVGATWGPDPEPAAFSASVLATDAAVIDVSGVGATLAAASFSVQAETPEAVAPPSFEQLMKSLGMIEIESLGDESDVASLSFLDATDASQELTCVTVDFNAETSRLSVAPTGNVGKGAFTVTAENDAGSCAVTVNVYSGRVVGYELEERVWGGDWSGVEDSGTDASGVGWNLLWRENEYRWKPIFENGIEPDVVQVRNVVVSAKPANATSLSPFAMGAYAYRGSSGGGTATTPAPTPESWPFAVGEPSVNGENEIAMSVTLCGVNLNNDTRTVSRRRTT